MQQRFKVGRIFVRHPVELKPFPIIFINIPEAQMVHLRLRLRTNRDARKRKLPNIQDFSIGSYVRVVLPFHVADNQEEATEAERQADSRCPEKPEE